MYPPFPPHPRPHPPDGFLTQTCVLSCPLVRFKQGLIILSLMGPVCHSSVTYSFKPHLCGEQAVQRTEDSSCQVS